MASAEQYPSGTDKESFEFSFDMLDFIKFQSDMMNKFWTPESRFIPKSTPHIVVEDLARAGAVSQPVDGGSSYIISWSNSERLAELRARNTKNTHSLEASN